ncbi:MAG: hypothetical protein KGH81_05665 [Thaumarchaeota archaeon]|nr:hypothetical protein [Nitrososphaerota archaeon]MDE1878279.1 hypothetical protein [Nitrososphaerota archaeon]
MKKQNKSTTLSFDTDHRIKIKKCKSFIRKLNREPFLAVIAHFDLPCSTQKIIVNQRKTITEMLTHNKICNDIVVANGGQVIKEMGDAVLAIFSNFPSACECALNVIHNFRKHQRGIHTKVTITVGTVEEISTRTEPDIYGAAVNLCERMSKYADEDSILIEESRFEEVSHWLPKDKRIKICHPREEDLREFRTLSLRKITLV